VIAVAHAKDWSASCSAAHASCSFQVVASIPSFLIIFKTLRIIVKEGLNRSSTSYQSCQIQTDDESLHCTRA
jgi:hypothetical protein